MGALPHQGPQRSRIAQMPWTTSSYFPGQQVLPWVLLHPPCPWLPTLLMEPRYWQREQVGKGVKEISRWMESTEVTGCQGPLGSPEDLYHGNDYLGPSSAPASSGPLPWSWVLKEDFSQGTKDPEEQGAPPHPTPPLTHLKSTSTSSI